MAQMTTEKVVPTEVISAYRAPRVWATAAAFLSAVGLAGSLYLSMGAGLKACPLCFYQRTFIMAIFAVLSVGLIVDREKAGLLCLLSVPLAFGGLGVAAFHEYLVLASKLECPTGLLDIGTVPVQSLAVFAILAVLTIAGVCSGRRELPLYGTAAVLGAAVLGLLLAWGAVASSPPMAARDKPYDPVKEPLDVCRPPFRAP